MKEYIYVFDNSCEWWNSQLLKAVDTMFNNEGVLRRFKEFVKLSYNITFSFSKSAPIEIDDDTSVVLILPATQESIGEHSTNYQLLLWWGWSYQYDISIIECFEKLLTVYGSNSSIDDDDDDVEFGIESIFDVLWGKMKPISFGSHNIHSTLFDGLVFVLSTEDFNESQLITAGAVIEMYGGVVAGPHENPYDFLVVRSNSYLVQTRRWKLDSNAFIIEYEHPTTTTTTTATHPITKLTNGDDTDSVAVSYSFQKQTTFFHHSSNVLDVNVDLLHSIVRGEITFDLKRRVGRRRYLLTKYIKETHTPTFVEFKTNNHKETHTISKEFDELRHKIELYRHKYKVETPLGKPRRGVTEDGNRDETNQDTDFDIRLLDDVLRSFPQYVFVKQLCDELEVEELFKRHCNIMKTSAILPIEMPEGKTPNK